MTRQSQLCFVFPSAETASYLLDQQEAYIEYKTWMAYLGEFLACFIPVYSRPDMTAEEALRHLEATGNHSALQPLQDNLETNRTTLIRLRAEYEIQKEVGKPLMQQYLDDSINWSIYMTQALKQKDINVALNYLVDKQNEDADTLNRLRAETIYRRALVHYDMGEVDSALADFERVIALDAQSADAYHNIGFLQQQNGNYAEALAAYNRAIEIEPNNTLYHFKRAELYEQTGHLKNALNDYNQMLSYQSDFEEAESHQARRIIHLSKKEKKTDLTGKPLISAIYVYRIEKTSTIIEDSASAQSGQISISIPGLPGLIRHRSTQIYED